MRKEEKREKEREKTQQIQKENLVYGNEHKNRIP